jgi:hypothetical protein
MSYHVISCHVMSYHVISCHIMSYHVISCHIMSYHAIPCHIVSYQVISWVIGLFRPAFNKVGRAGGVNFVFLGLRQQLRCQAEGKKRTPLSSRLTLPKLSEKIAHNRSISIRFPIRFPIRFAAYTISRTIRIGAYFKLDTI